MALLCLVVVDSTAIAAELDPAVRPDSGLRCDSTQPPIFVTAHDSSAGQATDLDHLLTQGVEYQTSQGTTATLSLSGAIDWELADGTRSARFDLNSFRFLSPLFGPDRSGRGLPASARSPASEEQLYALARAVVADWLRRYPYRANDPTGKLLDNGFAWYDMAVGRRAAFIGYLLRELQCRGDLDEEARALLERGARDHVAYLSRPWLVATNSNHGLYHALGLAALCNQMPTVEGCSSGFEFAIQQIAAYIESAFSASGIHKEHSPGYHQMLVHTLNALLGSELAGVLERQAPGIRCLSERASANVSWMTDPEGHLLRFGDTERVPRQVNQTLATSRSCQRTEFPGRASSAFGDFRDAGLVVFREGSGAGATMLAVQAAHHSRVHKQADDGTFELFSRGVPVIVDGGRFGYVGSTAQNSPLRGQGFYYSDPRRIHVESTHAHNTVEIDARTDNRVDRPAYGSAITAAGVGRGYFAVSLRLVREPLVLQERILLYGPDGWLLLIDWLDDLTGHPRDYAQWFQLHPSWRLASEDDQGFGFTREGVDWGVGIYPLGQDRPEMRVVRGATIGDKEPKRREGWLSIVDGMLEPTNSVAISRSGGQEVIATLVAMDDRAVIGSRVIRADAEDLRGLVIEAKREEGADVGVRIWRGREKLNIAISSGEREGAEQIIELPWKRPDRLSAADAFLEARAVALRGGPNDLDASKALDRAVELGSPDAASLLAKQAMERNDWPRARDLLKRAADGGDPQAAYDLGLLLARPRTSVSDPVAAVAWLEHAGLAGLRAAWYRLGEMYRRGTVVQSDLMRASDYLRRAAARGHLGAQTRLGELLIDDTAPSADRAEGISRLQLAADAGRASAANRLARLFLDPASDYKDPARGLELLRQAADAGVAEAQFRLGGLMTGSDVLAEAELGWNWIERAAQQGYEPAEALLRRKAP